MRKELKTFAEKQEEKLSANDHKIHWLEVDLLYLKANLLSSFNRLTHGDLSPDEIQDECVDVSNYSMMIYDSIEKSKEEGS